VILDFHALHVALLHLGDEFGIVDGLRTGFGRPKVIENGHQYDGDHYPEKEIFYEIVQTGYLILSVERLPAYFHNQWTG